MGRLVRARMIFLVVVAGVIGTGFAEGQQKSPPSWNELSPEQQGRARERYKRFRRLPERDRRSVEQLYRHWQELPPNKRERMRKNYERYMNLDPAQRKQFDGDYQRWKSGRNIQEGAGTE